MMQRQVGRVMELGDEGTVILGIDVETVCGHRHSVPETALRTG